MLGMTGGGIFMSIGGPKAHVALLAEAEICRRRLAGRKHFVTVIRDGVGTVIPFVIAIALVMCINLIHNQAQYSGPADFQGAIGADQGASRGLSACYDEQYSVNECREHGWVCNHQDWGRVQDDMIESVSCGSENALHAE